MTAAPGRLLPRASLVLIGLAWTLPFLQVRHRYPLTTFHSEWLAFALGLAAALVLLRQAAWREATVPWIALAPLGMIPLLGLQLALGLVPYPEQGLTAVLYLLWAALIVQLGHVLVRELGLDWIARTLSWFLLAGGVLAAVGGLLQHYEVSTALDALVARKGGAVVYGNIGQPNHYAAYLCLALAAAAYLFARERLAAVWAAPCVAVLLFVLALSGSRSAWLFVAALVVLALPACRRRNDAAARRLFALALCLLPGFALAQWLASAPLFQPESGVAVTSAQRLFATASGVEGRLQLMTEAWSMFVAAPLLGAGFGQFAWHHFVLTPAVPALGAQGLYNHAHNVVLQLLAETGLAGALVIGAAALHWLAGQRRLALDPERWWLLGAVAIVAVHSCLEFPLWHSYFLGIACFFLGAGSPRALRLAAPRLGRLAAAGALALGAFYVTSIVAPYREFERLVFQARPAADIPDERAYAEAVMRLHDEPLLLPYVELAVALGIATSPQDLRDKLELNARVMRFAPIAPVVYRHAALLQLSGEHALARRQLELAARAYPGALDEFARGLAADALRHPGELTPLLELAAAKSAELRARGNAR